MLSCYDLKLHLAQVAPDKRVCVGVHDISSVFAEHIVISAHPEAKFQP